jgi:alkaline phosphatase D
VRHRKSEVRLSRRAVLSGGAALGASLLARCQPRPYPDLAEEPLSELFPLGVASGDVTDREAVLWTRYAGGLPLRLSVALLGGNGVREAVLEESVPVTDGGFVQMRLQGLIPGAQYSYGFAEDGGDGAFAQGRFRAAPPLLASERLLFSASACSRNGLPFGALIQAATREADLHVLLGDTVYADGSATLEDYRARWAENLGTGAYRSLRARRSVLATWDDHEIADDWSGRATLDAQLESGVAAFFEHTPLRRSAVAPWRIWRSARWGLTAEFFVIDGRGERRPETRQTPDAEYISEEQLTWLEQGLKASPARFKVLVNSVPIGQFPGAFVLTEEDRWCGYRAQRDRLLSFIEENHIPGVFFVSGDFHMASIGRVSMDGPGASLLEILAGPTAAAGGGNPIWEQCRAPQFFFASATENNAFFHLDPQGGEVRVSWIAADGRALAEVSFHP